MAQLSVTIGGRTYRLACNPGEEARLEALAQGLDRKIQEMREAFGEIGDQRLTVMAALTFADDATESRAVAKREAARADAANARAEAALAESGEIRRAAEAETASLTQTVDELAQRMDALAAALSGKEAED